jgi:hypothetical protein
MLDLSGLESAVASQTTVEASLLTFLQGLKDQLSAELANDVTSQAKAQALMDQVIANNAGMSAAVTAVP